MFTKIPLQSLIKVTLSGSPSSSPSQSSSTSSSSSSSTPSQSSSKLSVLDLTVSYNISQLPTGKINRVKIIRRWKNFNFLAQSGWGWAGKSSLLITPLISRINFTIDIIISDLMSYNPFSQLNLRKLKQLKVVGKNHIWNQKYLLSECFKNTIEKLLTNKIYMPSIQKLEFLVDESKRSVEIVKLCRFFPSLKEVNFKLVMLSGIAFDCSNY